MVVGKKNSRLAVASKVKARNGRLNQSRNPRCGKPIFHSTSEFNKPHKQGISQKQALSNVTNNHYTRLHRQKNPNGLQHKPLLHMKPQLHLPIALFHHLPQYAHHFLDYPPYAPLFLITMQPVSISTYAPSP